MSGIRYFRIEIDGLRLVIGIFSQMEEVSLLQAGKKGFDYGREIYD